MGLMKYRFSSLEIALLSASLSLSVSRLKSRIMNPMTNFSWIDYAMLAKTPVHHFSGNNVSLIPDFNP